jgi:asparagine synthase (glutamine-hydrolysing)
MCGFIGFISDINDKQNDVISKKFDFYYKELKKRGPDYCEIKKIKFKSKIIQVGFVRLSIQDISQNSNKIFHDQNNIILFNGEIYNFNELREKYLSGEKNETNSDTEVLFKLYKLKGKNILNELRGIFSFVFIDLEYENIQFIRDVTGTKPLYFLKKLNSLFFSSEAWFLYSLSNKEINTDCLDFFFNFGFTKENDTLIRGVSKIPPRNLFKFNLNNFILSKEVYFDLNRQKNNNIYSKNETTNNVKDCIKKNLISDAKVGTFLSGGVDSTTVTLLAKRYNNNVEAFTTVFLPDEKFKKFNVDFKYAKKISDDYDIKLNVSYIESQKQFYDDFIKVTSYLDEPVSNLNFLNTYWQTKLAKEKNIKVVLTGDGADEIFCGYDRYKSAYIASKFKFFKHFNKKISTIEKLKNNEIPLHYYGIFKNINYEKFFNFRLNKNLITKNNYFDDFQSKYKIDYINYFDTRYWLTNESNYKLDKCSMINSIEARVPFQDTNLINQYFFLSNQKKFNFFNRKYILKNIDILPKYILNRAKMGWFSPERIFLDNHFKTIIKDFFSEKKIRKQNIFNYDYLIKFFEEYPKKTYRIKRQVLTLILFQIWYDKILNLI